MPQNWWEMFPEVVPSPAARPRPLPGPGAFMPGAAMAPQAGSPYGAFGPDQGLSGVLDPTYFSGGEPRAGAFPDGYPGQAAPSGYGQSPFGSDKGGPTLDGEAAIQHAADAIQRGADPNSVRARLIQMGHGDQEPPSPFSDLIPKGRPGMMGDSAPPPVQAQPAFDDQGGLEPRATGASYAQERLEKLPQRLDPRLAPQKAGDLQKYSQQKGSTRDPGPSTMFTYGVPSFPSDDRSRRGNPPRDPAMRNFPPLSHSTQGRPNTVRPVNQPLGVNDPRVSNLSTAARRRRRENQVLLGNPIIRAFLDTIAFAEGSDYNSLYGIHRTFTDRTTHPGYAGESRGGREQSAAGRYQIQHRTYLGLNRNLGPYTMSDYDQDEMAVELIREERALEPLLSGHFDEAVSRLGRRPIWAPFPILVNGRWQPNPTGQPTRNIEDLRARFNDALNRATRRGPGLAALATGLSRR